MLGEGEMVGEGSIKKRCAVRWSLRTGNPRLYQSFRRVSPSLAHLPKPRDPVGMRRPPKAPRLQRINDASMTQLDGVHVNSFIPRIPAMSPIKKSVISQKSEPRSETSFRRGRYPFCEAKLEASNCREVDRTRRIKIQGIRMA